MKNVSLEEKIKIGLERDCKINLNECAKICNSHGFSIGVAVSGGADSICLLISLCNILKNYQIPLKVISINHYIRPDEETCGDVEFVKNTCNQLASAGFNVKFFVRELEKGLVNSTAESRKMGIEEAARFLRYEAFDEFIQKEKILYLCLAHNKNDFYETVLMRFLQGASCDSFFGISFVRGKYIRPMLNVERNEIEDFLIQRGQTWRTDSTNSDTDYLRNKIRKNLMPFLSENFRGWKTAVEKGAKKAEFDSEFITGYVNKILIRQDCDEICSVACEDFIKEPEAVQIRLLLKMANQISENCRIPFVFLNEISKNFTSFFNEMKNSGINLSMQNNKCEKNFADISYFIKENRIYAKKIVSVISEYCFSDIITEAGFYEYDWGSLEVTEISGDGMNSKLFNLDLKYKSGKTDRIKTDLPYQLVINGL